MNSSAPLLSVHDLTKSFGYRTVLRGLTLDIPAGQALALMGPNGSGKSTLLRLICGLTRPDSGTVTVGGWAIPHEADRVRAHLGLVAHRPLIYEGLTARENLRFYGKLHGLRGTALDARIDEMLDQVGLGRRGDDLVRGFSRGMMQRLSIARAVLHKPDILLLDEPFTGLDPVNAEVVKDAVLDLRREGTTIVFSTHDMAVAERLCDRIFMIHKGRKVLDGTLEEIQARHGFDTIRLRTEGGTAALEELEQVEEVNDYGNVQEVRWRGDPRDLLQALASRTRVDLFEIARPSLHDIFVRIARPERTPQAEEMETPPNGKAALAGGTFS